jgi:hypothetical protein
MYFEPILAPDLAVFFEFEKGKKERKRKAMMILSKSMNFIDC